MPFEACCAFKRRRLSSNSINQFYGVHERSRLCLITFIPLVLQMLRWKVLRGFISVNPIIYNAKWDKPLFSLCNFILWFEWVNENSVNNQMHTHRKHTGKPNCYCMSIPASQTRTNSTRTQKYTDILFVFHERTCSIALYMLCVCVATGFVRHAARLCTRSTRALHGDKFITQHMHIPNFAISAI